MAIHHVCRNARCVNPDHLRALPADEHRAMHAVEHRLNIMAHQAQAGDAAMLMASTPLARWRLSHETARWALAAKHQ